MKERRKRHGTSSSRCHRGVKESLMRKESSPTRGREGSEKESWRRVAARDVMPQAETYFGCFPQFPAHRRLIPVNMY